jgi:AraC-like DNA-binding protein
MIGSLNPEVSTASVKSWGLQSIQVELRQVDAHRYGPYREVIAESHWQLAYMLEGDMDECLVDDNRRGHFHLRLAQGGCSLRYFPRGMRVGDSSPPVRRSLLLIRFSDAELLGQGRLRQEVEAAQRADLIATLTIPVNHQMEQIVAAIVTLQKETNSILPVLSCALNMLQQVVLVRELGQASAQEREKQTIETACRILESRLDNPPSLEELAAQVGMSSTRFKTAFNRVCGMPPFAWLRDQRLEKARCLLQHDGLRVTEVALEVGYTNFSHFAKIFEARFGLIPSRMRQEVAVRITALLFGLQVLMELA